MASKLQNLTRLADHAAHQITGSYQEWTAFLVMAGRLYKYPFSEQLLIYAQRPDATACAEYDTWKNRVGRYVRRGSTGIGIIDLSSGRPILRYVYDVADTGGGPETRPRLWEYRAEHAGAVSSALAQRFDAPVGDGSLPEQFEKIAAQFAAEYWYEHKQDILDIVDGSFLEEYDEFNIGVQFKNAAAVSMVYVLMSRCGLEAENYFSHEDFLNVFDFNTPDTLTELGTAVSQGSEAVLRQIEVTIKKYEREKSAERSAEHEERADIHAGGRRSAPQPDPGGAAGPGPGQVREDALDISEGAPSGPVQPPDAERDAVPSSAGDRGHSQQPFGADDAGAGESSGGHGAVEGQRPDEVGGADEHLQSPGGRNHPDRADLQLNTESESEGPSAEAPGPSAISHSDDPPPPIPASNGITNMDLDKILVDDWDADGRKQRIYAQFQQGRSDEEIAVFLRDEYLRGGYNDKNSGFVLLADGGRGYSYFVAAELRLRRRDVDGPMRYVKYEEMAHHIRALIDEGRYLTSDELKKYKSDHLEGVPGRETEMSAPVHVLGGTPPIPATIPPREITQADIDAALQEWNGDIASKRRVQQYMTDHARDRGTAEWLKNEYGDGLPAFPVTVEGAATDLPWTKVQRHLARLVKEDRFFTEEELDNLEDIDAAAIREHLEQVKDTPSAFVEQVMADVERLAEQETEQASAAPPTIQEVYEKYKPIVKDKVLADTAYQNACKNSDKETALLEGGKL